MDRLWGITITLSLLLLALWYFGGQFTAFFQTDLKWIFLAAAVICLAIGGFAFIGRHLYYVQAKADHILIATPFIRLKTSYRRVLDIRSSEYWRICDSEKMNWATRNYLGPFFAKTAVLVNLKDYPMSKGMLRVFIPKQMLAKDAARYVLLVRDWMTLSTELDSRFGGWRGRHTDARHTKGFMWQHGASKRR